MNTSANNEGFAIASADYTANGQRRVYRFCDGVTSGVPPIGSIAGADSYEQVLALDGVGG